MSHITGKRDDHLHLSDGTHRSTAATANGRDLARFERDIGPHLAAHAAIEAEQERAGA